MNCSSIPSLTVKYLASLSPIILMCVFDSAVMAQSIFAARHSSYLILYILPVMAILPAVYVWGYTLYATLNRTHVVL